MPMTDAERRQRYHDSGRERVAKNVKRRALLRLRDENPDRYRELLDEEWADEGGRRKGDG